MKKICNISGIVLISSLLIGCVTSNVPYAYDDLYYSPNNDPVQQAQKNTTEDLNRTNNIQYQSGYDNRYSNTEDAADNRQGVYQNRYTEQEQLENSQAIPNQEVATEQEFSGEYYDEDYAQTLQRMNSPVRSLNTYDPYQRDRIIYTQDPFFVTPSIYGGYQFWDPFVPTTGLSVGWNSFNGWNVGANFGFGVGFGCGRPLNPYFGFYDPFWGPNWGWGWNNWGWNNWGWNNWGWNNWGWGNGFIHPNNGYGRGFRDGYYSGRFDNNGSNSVRGGRRQITAPRGASGSRSVYTGDGNEPSRPTRGEKSGTAKTIGEPSNVPSQNTSTRPTRTTSPTTTVGKSEATRSNTDSNRPTDRSGTTIAPTPTRNVVTPSENSSPSRPVRSTTPERYRTTSTPSNYSNPTRERAPSRSTTPSRTTVQPNAPAQEQSRPNYSNPRQNNTYNRPTVTPSQPQRQPSRTVTTPRQPEQQSRPTYNDTRSRPTYNRSTPTYSAPRSSGGGGSSRGSSSRPTRR